MAKSRNNGRRAFGHRSSMTPRMKAIPSPRWRMELIITHLYGIMEHLSRKKIPCPGCVAACIMAYHSRSNHNGEWQWRLPVLYPGMQHDLQQLDIPGFMDHEQWRMIKSRDGKFTNHGSRINIDSPIREVLYQDEIISSSLIIAEIPRYLTGR